MTAVELQQDHNDAAVYLTKRCCLSVWLVMVKTKFGLILRATQLDSEIAQAFGIPISTVYSLVFGVGAAIAAVGAVLIVPIQQAHYLMGGEPLLLAFIVVIIGGLGSLKGTVAANPQ